MNFFFDDDEEEPKASKTSTSPNIQDKSGNLIDLAS